MENTPELLTINIDNNNNEKTYIQTTQKSIYIHNIKKSVKNIYFISQYGVFGITFANNTPIYTYSSLTQIHNILAYNKTTTDYLYDKNDTTLIIATNELLNQPATTNINIPKYRNIILNTSNNSSQKNDIVIQEKLINNAIVYKDISMNNNTTKALPYILNTIKNNTSYNNNSSKLHHKIKDNNKYLTRQITTKNIVNTNLQKQIATKFNTLMLTIKMIKLFANKSGLNKLFPI